MWSCGNANTMRVNNDDGGFAELCTVAAQTICDIECQGTLSDQTISSRSDILVMGCSFFPLSSALRCFVSQQKAWQKESTSCVFNTMCFATSSDVRSSNLGRPQCCGIFR